MEEVLLIKYGELALKGLNRGAFEDALTHNIRVSLIGLGRFELSKAQSTICLAARDAGTDMVAVSARVAKVFGIAAFSRSAVCAKEIGDILETGAVYLTDMLKGARTFKVEAKRSDKRFPLTSPEICARMGARLLETSAHLSVDVHEPDVTVFVEVRDSAAYIHAGQIPGAGGLPAGTAGKACVLLSGGIDSPVAAYRMAKRGLRLTAVHFTSPPYTSVRAEQKVRDLLRVLSAYAGACKLLIVPYTAVQERIKDAGPEELSTLLMRRSMMRIAQTLALQEECGALITGESLGQVASQTLEAIRCTDAVASLPVFRPLIGSDKEEIIAVARRIGTFDLSTLPYNDCCTVFTPRHPRTRPKLPQVLKAEEVLELAEFERSAAERAASEIIAPGRDRPMPV